MSFKGDLDKFKQRLGLTESEEDGFKATTFDILRDFLTNLQRKQEEDGNMRDLKRLEKFLLSMQDYFQVVKNADLFDDISIISSYLWVRKRRPCMTYKQLFLLRLIGPNEIIEVSRRRSFIKTEAYSVIPFLVFPRFLERVRFYSGRLSGYWRRAPRISGPPATLRVQALHERRLGASLQRHS